MRYKRTEREYKTNNANTVFFVYYLFWFMHSAGKDMFKFYKASHEYNNKNMFFPFLKVSK